MRAALYIPFFDETKSASGNKLGATALVHNSYWEATKDGLTLDRVARTVQEINSLRRGMLTSSVR